jgi:hypothetical protein
MRVTYAVLEFLRMTDSNDIIVPDNNIQHPTPLHLYSRHIVYERASTHGTYVCGVSAGAYQDVVQHVHDARPAPAPAARQKSPAPARTAGSTGFKGGAASQGPGPAARTERE